jgi:hypothetical protein
VNKDVRYLQEAENMEELDKHKLGCDWYRELIHDLCGIDGQGMWNGWRRRENLPGFRGDALIKESTFKN